MQGLGRMGMNFAYGPADADASRAALERALRPKGRRELRAQPPGTRIRRTTQSSASNSAFFEENSSSVTSPA